MTTPCFFAPVVITSSNDDVSLKMTGDASNFTGTVAQGTYTDHASFLDALVAGIEGANDGTNNWSGAPNNRTASWSMTVAGVVTLTFGGVSADVEVNWGTSSSTQALATLAGFPTSNQVYAYSSGSTVDGTGTSSVPSYWSPGRPFLTDSADGFEGVVVVVETATGRNKTTDFGGKRKIRSVSFDMLDGNYVKADESSFSEDFETWLRATSPRLYHSRFTVSDDYTSPATGADEYFLPEADVTRFQPARRSQPPLNYAFALQLKEFVS